jgi:hypothetical protein
LHNFKKETIKVRRILVVNLVCGGLLAVAFNLMPILQGQADKGGDSEVRKGFQVAADLGIPLNLSGKNPSLVGRGSFLVNGLSECLGCHIVQPPYLPGNNPHLGQTARVDLTKYLSGGRAFGTAISRNLTPDKNGLPAGLTFEQFERVMRFGTDFKALEPHVPSNPGLLQAMPWPQYRLADDSWIRAIYEYLKAIPCIEGGPGMLPNRC